MSFGEEAEELSPESSRKTKMKSSHDFLDTPPSSTPQQDYPPAPEPIEQTKQTSPPPKITKTVDTKAKDIPESNKKKHVTKPTPAPAKTL